jgi:ribonuclease P protein 3
MSEPTKEATKVANEDDPETKRCKTSSNSHNSPIDDAVQISSITSTKTEVTNNSPLFNSTTLSNYVTFYTNYKPPGKKKKNIPQEVLSTRRAIQHCCRDNDLSRGLQVVQTAIDECVFLEAQSFYNVLNLCEGSFGRVHVGTPKPRKSDDDDTNRNQDVNHGIQDECNDAKPLKDNNDVSRDASNNESPSEISLPHRLSYANEIHSLLTQLHIPCTEPTYTALIRLASRAGQFDVAQKYLEDAEQTQQCKVKLRLYSGLLRGYCGDYFHEQSECENECDRRVTKVNLIQALNVWKRMYEHSGCEDPNLFGEGISPKIQLSEVEYASLIKAATKLHDGKVMERVLSDLAERVLVPGYDTTESLLDWFRADGICHAKTPVSVLESVTLPPRDGLSIGGVCNENGKGWAIYKGCTIDSTTGQLTLGEVEGTASTMNDTFKLKPVELSEDAWVVMRQMNSKIVVEGQVEGHVSQYQGGGKGKKRPRGGNGNVFDNDNSKRPSNNHQNKKGEWRTRAWAEFESFLASHPPYNIVIDGANVGYFQQNFSNAPKHVDYKQIDWLLRHLLERNNGQHILLFLHERHFSPKLCPQWAFQIIKSWDGTQTPYDKLTVYRTPGGMNDDWYWMHAALLRGGTDSQPILAITNDEMRDHHFQMLAQGSFLRWKERHQVHFDFGLYNKQLGRREVLLQYPSRYSRRIQRVTGENRGDALIVPMPKKGDEERFVDGCHVAEDGAPDEETYVLIRRLE